jgi:tyrosine-protein kinase Etk/Wzc
MTKYTLETRAPSQPVVPVAGSGRDVDQPIEFSEYVEVVSNHRRLVAAIAITVSLLGTGYALMKQPEYESNMLIHVAERRDTETRPLFGHGTVPSEIKTAVAEMEVLRSRHVIEPVVERLGLHMDARPKYLFLIGPAIARRQRGLSEPGLFGHGGFCWGGERIKLAAFDVPDTLMYAKFVLTAGTGGRFRLTHESAGIDYTGMVGVPLEFPTADGPVRLQVAELHGRAGAEFLLRRIPKVAAIEGVQAALTVAELGKLSGMISVTLKGNSSSSVHTVLSEISQEYLRQNQSQKSLDASRSLSLLEAQLPALKQRMETAEAGYNAYRNQHGTADFTEETRLSLQRQSAAAQRLTQLEQKRNELAVNFGSAHPTMAAIEGQIKGLAAETRTLAAQVRQLPNVSQELERRSREVKAATELYNAVQRNVEDLRVVALDKSTNVRLVDAPVAPIRAADARVMSMAAAFFRKTLGR